MKQAWQENVDVLSQDSSYKLSGMIVHVFQGEKYLSISKDNFMIVNIDDIGNDIEMLEVSQKFNNGHIIVI